MPQQSDFPSAAAFHAAMRKHFRQSWSPLHRRVTRAALALGVVLVGSSLWGQIVVEAAPEQVPDLLNLVGVSQVIDSE